MNKERQSLKERYKDCSCLSVWINTEVYRKLKAAAAKEGMFLSKYVEKLIQQSLKYK